MLIKIDEDLPRQAADYLVDAGYVAHTVRQQDMGGWQDPELWVAIQNEGRFLVTADKGFGDIRRYAPGEHGGILLLRPDSDGIRPLLDLLALVLAQVDLEQLIGTVAVATPRGLRVRRR